MKKKSSEKETQMGKSRSVYLKNKTEKWLIFNNDENKHGAIFFALFCTCIYLSKKIATLLAII